MKLDKESERKLVWKGRIIAAQFKFWLAVSMVTRIGVHGFVLMMLRHAVNKVAKFNEQATNFNKRAQKERRRVEAIRRSWR